MHSPHDPHPHHLLRRIRLHLTLFILGLILSGLTAFPLQLETESLARLLNIPDTAAPASYTGLHFWIATTPERNRASESPRNSFRGFPRPRRATSITDQ